MSGGGHALRRIEEEDRRWTLIELNGAEARRGPVRAAPAFAPAGRSMERIASDAAEAGA